MTTLFLLLQVSLTTPHRNAEHTKEEILKIFSDMKIGVYQRKECSDETYNLIFATQKDGFRFLECLYEDCELFLEGKRERYFNIKANFKL